MVDRKEHADSHTKTGSADSGIPRDVETSVVESECINYFFNTASILDNIYNQ